MPGMICPVVAYAPIAAITPIIAAQPLKRSASGVIVLVSECKIELIVVYGVLIN